MIPDDIQEVLIKLLGKNAINNNMQVEGDFGKVVSALSYLILQLPIALRNSDEVDREYGQILLTEVKKTLNGEK